uniref:Metalloendopeptidase n=1 Tax=Pristhesancus plagipennis TaxID=1955184 RepID=A0A1Q1NP88_PRIPG|nr:venom astacin-like protein 2 [Pristhesancus plagipennis]
MIFLVLLVSLSATLAAPPRALVKMQCNGKECDLVGRIKFPEEAIREGDILEGASEGGRNALINTNKLWKNGRVPYVYHKDILPASRAKIENAMRLLEAQTCAKFVPWDESMGENYLMVLANSGCFATVGFSRSSQRYLNLNQRGCLGYVGTIQHELLHVLGLEHEQSRPDRDNHVTILKENIKDGMEKNFKIVGTRDYSTLDVPYDYNSLMHYSAYSFSKNGKATVLPKDPTVDPEVLGQRKGPSEADLKKINILYKCNK